MLNLPPVTQLSLSPPLLRYQLIPPNWARRKQPKPLESFNILYARENEVPKADYVTAAHDISMANCGSGQEITEQDWSELTNICAQHPTMARRPAFRRNVEIPPAEPVFPERAARMDFGARLPAITCGISLILVAPNAAHKTLKLLFL